MARTSQRASCLDDRGVGRGRCVMESVSTYQAYKLWLQGGLSSCGSPCTILSTTKRFTNAIGAPVADNTNIMTAGPRGPALLQDIWLIEKLAHFDREVIPERRMHAKGWGAHGTFTVTHDITRFTKAKIFSEIGKQTPMFARFSTVAGERGAA